MLFFLLRHGGGAYCNAGIEGVFPLELVSCVLLSSRMITRMIIYNLSMSFCPTCLPLPLVTLTLCYHTVLQPRAPSQIPCPFASACRTICALQPLVEFCPSPCPLTTHTFFPSFREEAFWMLEEGACGRGARSCPVHT